MTLQCGNPPILPRYPWLYALPQGRLPPKIECAGKEYSLQHTFKHDFFAATGAYETDSGNSAVLKIGRISSLFGLPMSWIGKRLRDREVRIYGKLQDIDGVPRLVGNVGKTAFLHEFVPGHPLGRDERVSDSFFDELSCLLAEIHRREIAYVDLNKRQNVLVGDDRKPYLIDFQISYDLPPRGVGRWWPRPWILRRLQRADVYHFCKHKRRLRPDLLSDAERAIVERVGFWIRLHRFFARPIIQVRRRFLRWLKRGERAEVAGSSAK